MQRIACHLMPLVAALSSCNPTPPADSAEMVNRLAVDSSSSSPSVERRRWKANPETTEAIRGMRALLSAYPANGLEGGLLCDSFEARMGAIFEGYTMEGEAHLALHDYLLPLIKLLRDLPDSPEQSSLDSISVHLARFDEGFR